MRYNVRGALRYVFKCARHHEARKTMKTRYCFHAVRWMHVMEKELRALKDGMMAPVLWKPTLT